MAWNAGLCYLIKQGFNSTFVGMFIRDREHALAYRCPRLTVFFQSQSGHSALFRVTKDCSGSLNLRDKFQPTVSRCYTVTFLAIIFYEVLQHPCEEISRGICDFVSVRSRFSTFLWSTESLVSLRWKLVLNDKFYDSSPFYFGNIEINLCIMWLFILRPSSKLRRICD